MSTIDLRPGTEHFNDAVEPGTRTAQSVEVRDATKVIDGITVLDRVTFTAMPGRIVALLGPNGAGKSTMLRCILGLDRLTSGQATIGGMPFRSHARPAQVVGALLSPDSAHPRRTARGHLRVAGAASGLDAGSVPRTMKLTGITEIADLPVGEMSLGMRQRLALATALIGDPAVLVLDEPHNGLDAAAIRWLRVALRTLADGARTILLSTHLMAEVERIADDVVVIDQGSVRFAGLVRKLSGEEDGAGRGQLEERYLDLVGTDRVSSNRLGSNRVGSR